MRKNESTTLPVIERAGDLLSRYAVLFCDVWGVVHDGVRAYPGANAALPRFRERGGTVVLVSNAPLPADKVEEVLAEKGVRRDAWDAIVSSGDLARARLLATGATRVHHIGPKRDLALFLGAGAARVPLDQAESLVVTGLVRDDLETAEDYRPTLAAAQARGLELLCANPDLLVEVGPRTYPCAGALAALYEAMGGRVYWAGKPHRVAYEAAFAVAERLRGVPVARSQVLAIGDAVRTDLAGAAGAGVDALFVTGGIHREAVTVGGFVDAGALQALLGPETRTTVAATPALVW
jgi:HAD superfamily hydrolase (TIGR01459 family)